STAAPRRCGSPPIPKCPRNALRGQPCELGLALQAGLAQLVGEVEQVLVGDAEACRALRRPDDVAGSLQEPPPPLPRLHRVLQGGTPPAAPAAASASPARSPRHRPSTAAGGSPTAASAGPACVSCHGRNPAS